jgi:hypothetical protein
MFRILILLLLFSSCIKKKFSSVQLVGHAASGLNNIKSPFTDNSLEAVNYALSFDDCSGIELDVQMSADGVLYCYHDADLDAKTTMKGCVPQLTSAELDNVKYNFPSMSRLLKLSDLNNLNWNGRSVYFDLRLYEQCNDKSVDISKIITAFKNTGILSNANLTPVFVVSNLINVASFDSLQCSIFLECFSYAEALNVADTASIDGIILRNKLVSKDQIALLKQKKEVMLYEVRAAKPTRLALRKNPNYLMTDDLETAINEKY